MDPKERVGRFSYAQATRRHLEDKLDRHNFDLVTEASRIPHTLVVTKTRNKHEMDLKGWQNSIDEMRKELDGLDVLLEPLGINATAAADLDAHLVSAGAAEGVVPAAKQLQLASASVQNLGAPKQVAGVKRKSDVIDLIED